MDNIGGKEIKRRSNSNSSKRIFLGRGDSKTPKSSFADSGKMKKRELKKEMMAKKRLSMRN